MVCIELGWAWRSGLRNGQGVAFIKDSQLHLNGLRGGPV